MYIEFFEWSLDSEKVSFSTNFSHKIFYFLIIAVQLGVEIFSSFAFGLKKMSLKLFATENQN